MITPRRTRLVRVPSLHSFRRAIVALAETSPPDATCVVVPAEEAAIELAGAFQVADRERPAPHIVTREQLYDRFFDRLDHAPRRLTTFEREVILQASARAAIAAGAAPPFRLRPGLVAEMLRFYDQLRRQRQTVARFAELVEGAVAGDDDRGAERLQKQTRFLTTAYAEYERRLDEAGAADEHRLREHVTATPAAVPIHHVVIAVGDWIADAHGLFAADFDLLTRVPGLAAIDVVATNRLLASGFHERLHTWLPGLEEWDDVKAIPDLTSALPASTPRLLVPEARPGGEPSSVFVCRDREEELIRIARRVVTERLVPSRVGIVFARPLPYVYIAPEVFAGARLAYQTSEGLPLAAEPAAAALDLAIEFASSQFGRSATMALLRSAQFRFAAAEGAPEVSAADELRPLLSPDRASAQLTRLVEFLAAHAVADGITDRERLGREMVGAILTSMASAYAAHDDRAVTIDELAPEIRRWVEGHALRVPAERAGVKLLGPDAARLADLDEAHIVGAIENEWPEPPRRNIFYPSSVLASVGWPSEQDRRSAATAAFLDLLSSASRLVSVSTFSLDDDAVVEPASLVEELPDAGLSPVSIAPNGDRVFLEEMLSMAPPLTDRLEPPAAEWLALRTARRDGDDPAFHGTTAPCGSRSFSVSAVETYLACPFKYFAQHVLHLEEEPDEDEVMDPKKQGQLVHEVFEAFFSRWQEEGRGAIRPENIDTARELFAAVVEDRLATVPEAEAALERTRLLGSSVATGLGEIVFRMEAERPVAVVERLLEHRLSGEFDMAGPDGARRVHLRGVADRLDLLADGTFRLIDYKLSSAPQKSRALQLPIYGVCAEQRLEGRHGRHWTLGEAAYIAFRGAKRVAPLFTVRSGRDEVLASAQARLIEAVDGIERGHFPPTPDDAFLCTFCAYGTVCRKDYIGDV